MLQNCYHYKELELQNAPADYHLAFNRRLGDQMPEIDIQIVPPGHNFRQIDSFQFSSLFFFIILNDYFSKCIEYVAVTSFWILP